MRIALNGPPAEVVTIQELLRHYDVTFTELDDSDIEIVYKQKPSDVKKAIVIPSNSEKFKTWSKVTQIETTQTTNNTQIIYTKTAQITLSIKPEIIYKNKLTTSSEVYHESIGIKTNDNFILELDVIGEYFGFLSKTLAAQQSKLYRIFTGLPIPYGIAPKKVRDYFMSDRTASGSCTLCDKLHVDALRLILIQAINNLTGKELKQKKWNGHKFTCLLTHDIEDFEGLQRASQVKKLEEKYDLPSAWFIPSNRYSLKNEIIETLTNFGEVGAHDTKHDGKLATLSKPELIERFSEAKQSLKEYSETSINGFRAPLLQHNFQILEALQTSGYVYDASVPTWEPKHPYTMKAHGIGTIFPLCINSFSEVPLTLPQDHQMLHALGLTPQQTVENWAQMMQEIKALGGLCVILTHPNELANQENQISYEDLLNRIVNEKESDVTLPMNVAQDLY